MSNFEFDPPANRRRPGKMPTEFRIAAWCIIVGACITVIGGVSWAVYQFAWVPNVRLPREYRQRVEYELWSRATDDRMLATVRLKLARERLERVKKQLKDSPNDPEERAMLHNEAREIDAEISRHRGEIASADAGIARAEKSCREQWGTVPADHAKLPKSGTSYFDLVRPH